MKDMSELMPFLLEAMLRANGAPSPKTLLELRKTIHETIPNWQHLIGFCLCMLDDCIWDSGGTMTREEICELWLGANEYLDKEFWISENYLKEFEFSKYCEYIQVLADPEDGFRKPVRFDCVDFSVVILPVRVGGQDG